MSVVFFSAEELGNAAAYLARDKWAADGDLQRYAKLLAAYSRGNAAAYNYRYPNEEVKAVGFSEQEILAAAISVQEDRSASVERAQGTIRLLSYNGPEGEGLERFRGRAAYYRALTDIYGRAYGKVLRTLEEKVLGRGFSPGREHY